MFTYLSEGQGRDGSRHHVEVARDAHLCPTSFAACQHGKPALYGRVLVRLDMTRLSTQPFLVAVKFGDLGCSLYFAGKVSQQGEET